MELTPALVARAALGAVGAAMLLRGAAIYRPTLWLSAFGAGAVGVVALSPAGADPRLVAGAGLLAGLVSVAITAWVHRAGLVVIGAVVGGTAAVAVSSLVEAGSWSVAVGALAGALLLPFGFDRALPYTTPAIGAVLLATAADRSDNVLVLGVLYVVGVAAQLASRDVERE